MIPDPVSNILSVFDEASVADADEGESWYLVAHRFCADLARDHNLTTNQAAGIVAALSPRVSWDLNLRMAETLCRTGTVAGLKGNVTKAQRILVGESPEIVLGGPKVRAFYRTIANPDTSYSVVIDRHAFDIVYGESTDDRTRKALDRKGMYDFIAEAYVAASYHRGVRPHVMQATTWVTWRRLKGQA